MTTENANAHEIHKFSSFAEQWWDVQGKFKTLHAINPLRLRFIQKFIDVKGQAIVDVGCGGGILSEGLAKIGADVTGIDLSEELIAVADLHGLESGIKVNYLKISAEALAVQKPIEFNHVVCMEMLEHTPNPKSTVKACAQMVKPGGWVFFSTLNRKPQAYLMAILGAEYILQMLPKGTHDYKAFIRPSELSQWARQAGLALGGITGVLYNPFKQSFSLGKNIDVNYIVAYQRQ